MISQTKGHFKSSSVYIVEPLSVVEWLAVAKRLFLSVRDGQCKEVVIKRVLFYLLFKVNLQIRAHPH